MRRIKTSGDGDELFGLLMIDLQLLLIVDHHSILNVLDRDGAEPDWPHGHAGGDRAHYRLRVEPGVEPYERRVHPGRRSVVAGRAALIVEGLTMFRSSIGSGLIAWIGILT